MRNPLSSETSQRNIVALAWVSFFNDLGSEVVGRLIPLFLAGVIGAPMSAIGAVEGLAEATATLLKPVFGALSDRLGRRKVFIVWGYLLSSLSRPLLGLAGSWFWVALFRFGDRFGKSLRTAPRDALIADSSSTLQMGRSFGLNRALDTAGALLGIGFCALWFRHGQALGRSEWLSFNLVFGIAGIFTLAFLIFGVREIAQPSRKKEVTTVSLPRPLKRYLLWVGVFSLANSSDAFIILRARELGYSLLGILGLIALFNLVSAATTLPAAILSDRIGRKTLIFIGWIIYAASYAAFGSSLVSNPFLFGTVAAVYGLFYGFTDSIERAWIADLAPDQARGRAYGVFGLVVGLTTLPASVLFGWIWDHFGSVFAFESGAAVALVAGIGLLTLKSEKLS